MKRLHHPTLARAAALFLILLLLAAGVGCAGRHRRTKQTAPLPDGDLALFPEAASFEAIETGDPEAKYGDGQFGDTRILRDRKSVV